MLAQNEYPLLLSGEERVQWNFTLERPPVTATGICIVGKTPSGVVGTVVNEFGIQMFDFTAEGDKVKVSNVFPQMNKWYIRRVLRNDLRVLVADQPVKLGKRVLQVNLPDSISLLDKKYRITYRFERLTQQ